MLAKDNPMVSKLRPGQGFSAGRVLLNRPYQYRSPDAWRAFISQIVGRTGFALLDIVQSSCAFCQHYNEALKNYGFWSEPFLTTFLLNTIEQSLTGWIQKAPLEIHVNSDFTLIFCNDWLIFQVDSLQIQIDDLYQSAFAGIEVTYKPQGTSKSNQNEDDETVTESFEDLNESAFGMLGRQRQHVMKASSGLCYVFSFHIPSFWQVLQILYHYALVYLIWKVQLEGLKGLLQISWTMSTPKTGLSTLKSTYSPGQSFYSQSLTSFSSVVRFACKQSGEKRGVMRYCWIMDLPPHSIVACCASELMHEIPQN